MTIKKTYEDLIHFIILPMQPHSISIVPYQLKNRYDGLGNGMPAVSDHAMDETKIFGLKSLGHNNLFYLVFFYSRNHPKLKILTKPILVNFINYLLKKIGVSLCVQKTQIKF